MTRDQVQAQGLVRIKRMSVLMIIGYAIIVVIAVLGITAFTVTKYDELTKDKVSSMTSTLNVQLKLNLDSYMKRMEKIGTLAYSVDNAYTYDATSSDIDEYEAINTEKQIAADLSSLCLMENFVDYGIVYSNNHTVGKVSNGTVKLFGDKLYSDLSAMISRENTHDGWSTGYNNGYDRIYYVKKLHKNAIFVISFYTAELDSVLENPEALSDMAVRLTDRSYRMIYSSVEGDTVGKTIPDDVLRDVKGNDMAVISGADNLSTINATEGDWYIICSIPTDIILREAVDMKKVIYLAAAVASLIAVLAGTVFVRRMADPVSTVTAGLSDEISEDGFEKVLGSRFFRDKADNVISANPKQEYAVILAGIDELGDMLNRCGRNTADSQIVKLVKLIKEEFPDCECIGRVGEETFAVLMKNSGMEKEEFRSLVISRGVNICDTFKNSVLTSPAGSFEATASAGAAIGTEKYQSIYDDAFKALCASEKNGKSRFTIA